MKNDEEKENNFLEKLDLSEQDDNKSNIDLLFNKLNNKFKQLRLNKNEDENNNKDEKQNINDNYNKKEININKEELKEDKQYNSINIKCRKDNMINRYDDNDDELVKNKNNNLNSYRDNNSKLSITTKINMISEYKNNNDYIGLKELKIFGDENNENHYQLKPEEKLNENYNFKSKMDLLFNKLDKHINNVKSSITESKELQLKKRGKSTSFNRNMNYYLNNDMNNIMNDNNNYIFKEFTNNISNQMNKYNYYNINNNISVSMNNNNNIFNNKIDNMNNNNNNVNNKNYNIFLNMNNYNNRQFISLNNNYGNQYKMNNNQFYANNNNIIYNNNNLFNNNNFMNNNEYYNNIDRNNEVFINIEVIIDEEKINIVINPEKTINDLINKISLQLTNVDIRECPILFNSKDISKMNRSNKLSQIGLYNYSKIMITEPGNITGGKYLIEKEINIQFVKINDIIYNNYVGQKQTFDINDSELFGLLKLCLLKEIAFKLKMIQINKLETITSSIMEILKNGRVKSSEAKLCIKEVLEKMTGSNIINFSRYVDGVVSSKDIKEIIKFLKEDDLIYINEVKNCLIKYNEHIKLFEKEFEKAKKESIFEFSPISLIIMDRKDFSNFEKERKRCRNKIDKILYHGTSIDPISNILIDKFKKSINKCFQHGKGVYFTDILDYCWFYGSQKDNRYNKNKIPPINDMFTLIACSIYYNKKGFRKVIDERYTPKKNEINFAYADAYFNTLEEIDESKFYGTEYVIYDLSQICPFIALKLKRDKFCVIWRDVNFSDRPVYNNSFDDKFKKFLKNRISYIQKLARFNIYTCEESEEALKLLKRKKYNKIILISNIGDDLGGKEFIDEARKILENDIIVLFLSYNIQHLEWIKNYNNALFSNEPEFYESYLECFSQENENKIKDSLYKLKRDIEKHYGISLNFNDKLLDYPLFRESGKYSDLRF